MTRFAIIVLAACGAPETKKDSVLGDSTAQVDSAVPSRNDTADTSPGDTAGVVSDSGVDTGTDCPTAPWLTAEPGEPIVLPAGVALDAERALKAEEVATALFEDEEVAGVFWRDQVEERYVFRTPAGAFTFDRRWDADLNMGLWWSGDSPWPDDPMADMTLADELDYSNPEGTSYPELDYAVGDARLAFPESESLSHPRQMARVSALFDSPNAPDMGLVLAPYAAGGVGTHGGLSMPQSRAPFVMRGPGVVPGHYAVAIDQVDIAPTVAGLLGVSPIRGVNGRISRWVDGQMLAWQDGQVRSELLASRCAWGAAQRAVVLILDGLSHTELLDGLASGRYPNLSRIADGGAIADGGSIVGWPSMSLPGHLSVYTGAYQGHHGLISNAFRDRASGAAAPGVELWEVLVDPLVAGAAMTAYLSTDVETLFEAVGRSFPESQTASISELAFRGATWGGSTEGPPAPPLAGDYTKYRVADQLTVVQVERMVAEIGLPKLLAASFYLTDGVGEGAGPHGDALRAALVETDARVGQVLDVYEREAGFEDTVFVLTSDHGMALQDSARTSAWSAALSASGVPVTTHGHMIYFD